MLFNDGSGSMERKGLLIDFDHAQLKDGHHAADPADDGDDGQEEQLEHHQQALECTVRSVFLLCEYH